MKYILTIIFVLFSFVDTYSQASGNINYQKQRRSRVYDYGVNVSFSSRNNIIISVKGQNNVKADEYVAIFSLTQTGKTHQEVDKLMNNRLQAIESSVKEIEGVSEFFVDMVSFVPQYEYDVEKKLFSRTTYNEIPKGFELKKNIHIRYSKHKLLDKIVSVCAKQEVYDLVVVDYILKNLEAEKQKLRGKAKSLLKKKLAFQRELLQDDLVKYKKEVVEGFKIFHPVDRYNSYQAFATSSLQLRRKANVKTAPKNTTLHYKPITNKVYDFIINPVIVEPVVQILYEVKMRIKLPPPPEDKLKSSKEYYLVTPEGRLERIELGK